MSNLLAFSPSVQLTEMNCGVCGITFAVPESFQKERARDHSIIWYCPNGHPRVYSGKTEAEKLRDQLAEKERLLAVERERAATNFTARMKAESEVRKLKTRAKNGVCPCCKRSFAALKKHIATKHPEFAAK